MLAPAQTSVFGRRLLSFLIDGSLVVAAALAVAWNRAESFAIVERNDAGDAVFSGADAARLLELDQFELAGFKLARYQELGDTGYAFGEDAIVPAALIGLLAAFALFALVPMVIGRTVGMVPTGLRIGTTDGERAGVVQHLGRTLLGVVDLIPVAIPGLLGFALIGLTKRSQRLGDLLTGTTVFKGAKDGSDTPPLSGIVAEAATPARPSRPVRSEELDDEMVDVAGRLDPDHDLDLDLDLELDEISTDEAGSADTEAQRAVELARAAAAAEVPTVQLDDPDHEGGEGLSLPPWAPPGVAPAAAHHWGSDTNRDGTPLDEVADEAGLLSDDAFPEVPPPPATRPDRVESIPSAVDGAAATTVSTSGNALGAPSSLLDDTAPLPPPPSHRRGASAAAEASSSSEQQTATAEFERNEVRVEDVSWDPPVAEPAPVWQPTAYEPETLGEPAPPQATTDPPPAEEQTAAVPPTETAPTAEPTIEEPPAAEAPTAAEPVRAEPVKNNTTAPGTPKTANDPVWSDKWGAWLFWDAKGERWLLHDESKDTWIPIS